MSNSTSSSIPSTPQDPSSTVGPTDISSSTTPDTTPSTSAEPVTPSSTQPESTTTVSPTTTRTSTSTSTASTKPPTTKVVTHVTTIPATTNGNGETQPPQVVVITRTTGNTQTGAAGAADTSSTSGPAALTGGDGGSGGSGGLGTSGITAIAVVIPIVVVALLVGLGIFLWRKRKQRKENEDQRRKEVEDYSYNPNGDPTLPAVGSEVGGAQMTEDHSSGYRGWGAAAGSNRKASTTLSGGHTQQLSDAGSNAYGGPSPHSPGYSDGHSSDPIMNNRDTMGSDDLGALGVAPAAGAGAGIRRGPSNASSAYSAGGRSEHSDDAPPVPNIGQAYDYPQAGYGYGQHGPYGDGTYGGGQNDAGMPMVREVSARRNTRIQPGGAYQQGNSGIAQNF